MSEKNRKRLTIVGLIFAIVCLILLSLKNQVYYPEMPARDAVKSAKAKKNFTYFEGSKKPLVIFYPGALVEPESYGIWAKKVAENGYPVAIAHFPLDFALLSVNRADQIDKKGGYVIGGHSLGGVCAARYAAERKHQKNLKGVFLMASYADEKGDLSKTKIPVLQITASRDGVIKKERLKENSRFLPENAVKKVIQGGNHSGFGAYTTQKGDNKARISTQQQQEKVAEIMIGWLDSLNRK